MTLQRVLNNLKTARGCQLPTSLLNPRAKIADAIITRVLITSSFQQIPANTTTLLSNLTPSLLHLILSDPHLSTTKCFDFFNFLYKNQSLITFRPNIDVQLAFLCRLVESRSFVEAENLLRVISSDEIFRYPFSLVVSFFEKQSVSPKVSAKVFNLLLKVFSDNGNFDQASETFNFMRDNGIEINERTCTIHLIEYVRCDKVEQGLRFFYRMVESGLEVSVFSLTVMVDGLCNRGEIKRARELVEEMSGRGIKPNVITCNSLVDACTKRWTFEELDVILKLMVTEDVEFNPDTYKLLIDGFSSSKRIEEAERMLLEMHDKGFKVDAHLYNLIINGYCRLGNIEKGSSLFCQMNEKGISPNADTYWPLISSLCNVGQMELVNDMVHEMQSKGCELDHVMFNSLINGYCREGMIHDALQFLNLMEKRGFIAELSVYEMVIGGLCKLNENRWIKLLLVRLIKRGVDVNMLSSIPSLESAINCKDHVSRVDKVGSCCNRSSDPYFLIEQLYSNHDV